MPDILTREFHGQKFYFNNTPTALMLINEIFSDNYEVFKTNLEFSPGDVILDVGACEGMFSIMLAKLFPQTRIIALEPVPQTYFLMMRNIGLNGATNIEAFNIGLGKKGQKTAEIYISKDLSNTGGSSSLFTFNPESHTKETIGVISLDDAFDLYGIDRCHLLKMDIEGLEYDVLYGSSVLPKVDYMTMEIHHNQRLVFQSRRPDALAVWVSHQTKLLHVDFCRMAE